MGVASFGQLVQLRRLDFATLSMAIAATLSGAMSLVYFGSNVSCAFGVLFDRASRFSDWFSVRGALDQRDPWATGFEYPPGSLPAIYALRAVEDSPFGTFVQRLLRPVADLGSPDVGLTCPTNAISGSQILLLLLASIALGLFVFFLVVSSYVRSTRIIGSTLAGTGLFLTGVLVDFYPLILLVVGGAFIARRLKARRSPEQMPGWWYAVPFATCYPVIFGWDRGNLDLLVGVLIMLGSVAAFGSTKLKSTFLAPALFGLAAGIKLWPIYLLGLFIRPMSWRKALVLLAAAALATLAGLWLVEASLRDGASGFVAGLTRRTDESESLWLLVFNRTLTSGMDSLWLVLRESNGPLRLDAFWRTFRQVIHLLAIPIAIACLAMARPVWVRFALSATLVILLSSTSGTYRLSVLLVALGLAIANDEPGQKAPSRDRIRTAACVLMGLAISPLFVGSFGVPTPTDAPWDTPSDTLLGTVVLVALLGVLFYKTTRSRPRDTSILTEKEGT